MQWGLFFDLLENYHLIFLQSHYQLRPYPVTEARELLAAAPGVELLEDPASNRFPMPTDVTGRDPVVVGRIRQDISEEKALEFWLCGDQIRKGAALNAIQIAELLLPAA